MRYLTSLLFFFYSVFCFGGQYDRLGAVQYATKYATTPNSATYPVFDRDCTNFASQVLIAGGAKMTVAEQDLSSGKGLSGSDADWFIKASDKDVYNSDAWISLYKKDSITRSASWGLADKLYFYLLSSTNRVEFSKPSGGLIRSIKYKPTSSAEELYGAIAPYIKSLKIGDLIFFDAEGQGRFSHATVVTKLDDQGNAYISYHSHFRLNKKVQDFIKSMVDNRESDQPYIISLVSVDLYSTYDYINSKKVQRVASIHTDTNFVSKIFDFLGIRSAFADSLSSLFAYINQPYTIRVDGTGFDGNEAVSIDGSTCDRSTIQRGSGYFTQSCKGGSVASEANKLRVYDTKYDLDIEVPPEYQTMSLRGPVVAPLAPALTEQSPGTIRLQWSAVTGATGYEISRTGQVLATLGAVTSYDDSGRTPGTMYCYRLRAIQNGVLSAYSPESCLTVATLKCQSQWTAAQYNPSQTETRTLACQSGYTGNINQTHVCQSNGQWGQVSEQNSCTAIPAPTCAGSWSSTKYLVGQTEEKYENACPAGTQGQVRSWHTCQSSGSSTSWSGLAQSDNCKAYLATPSGVYASSVSGGVQITWGGVSGATSYNLYKNGNLYRSNLTSTSYIDTYVTNGVTYTYSVSAYSNYNSQNVTSPASGGYSVVYRDGEVGVSPPTGVSASQYTQYSQKGIRLTWTSAANADSYLIYRRGYSNPYTSATFLAPVSGGSVSFNDWVTPGFIGGVVSGQSYCYYIRSVRGSANSIESNEACAIAP